MLFRSVLVDAARLGAIGRTLATCTAAAAMGLRVAAVVLSHVERLSGSDSDPASPSAIARASASDLSDRLAPVPVAVLPHAAETIDPDLDWQALA